MVKGNNFKRIKVLFSGGLDSTYLVYKLLKEGHEVSPCYVTIENNTNKVAMELKAINKLYDLFHKEFGDWIKPIEKSLTLTRRNILSIQ